MVPSHSQFHLIIACGFSTMINELPCKLVWFYSFCIGLINTYYIHYNGSVESEYRINSRSILSARI